LLTSVTSHAVAIRPRRFAMPMDGLPTRPFTQRSSSFEKSVSI